MTRRRQPPNLISSSTTLERLHSGSLAQATDSGHDERSGLAVSRYITRRISFPPSGMGPPWTPNGDQCHIPPFRPKYAVLSQHGDSQKPSHQTQVCTVGKKSSARNDNPRRREWRITLIISSRFLGVKYCHPSAYQTHPPTPFNGSWRQQSRFN